MKQVTIKDLLFLFYRNFDNQFHHYKNTGFKIFQLC